MALSLNNLRSPAALARFILTAAMGIAIDQWTKIVAFSRLSSGILRDPDDGKLYAMPVAAYPHGYPVITGLLHFTPTANRGAVFGIGQGHLELFIAVSALAIAFIVWLFLNSERQWLYQIVLGMLLAGVIGNLYDRAEFGYVRDMIYIFPRWGIFPYVFNVADSLLCTGVAIMILYSLFQPMKRPGTSPHLTAHADPKL
jgi:lipoprotein signal peptidase